MNTQIHNLVANTLVPHSAFHSALAQLEEAYRFSEGSIEPDGIHIIGESRTGKSRLAETFLQKYPMTRLPDGIHCPILSVSVPSNPSKNSLVEKMLIKFGDPKPDKGNQLNKTQRLEKFIADCGTRMIFIDEFQHYIDKASHKVAYDAADWLKGLLDDTKVTAVFIGLPNSLDVFRFNEQLNGRSDPPICMPRFNWMTDGHIAEFTGILESFCFSINQHFETPDFTTDEMVFRIYCATGGLMGYLTRLLRRMILEALTADRRVINFEHINGAFERSLSGKEPDAKGINPFSRDMNLIPTQDLLDRVNRIGTRAPEPSKKRRSVKGAMEPGSLL